MAKNNNSNYPAMISVRPDVHLGKPRMAGTGIPVVGVLELIEAGVSFRRSFITVEARRYRLRKLP
ncbi:MAG: DUF433 domain-containing protein [candidate division KSB1 bacterium]|nr:DUF433 domain-containing protein [candidate division KSB1 bacterium]MDZ7365884.1 DUF433 domain-containing protein [candidate division KSB1 bacterium]MDZ7403881.1 DUF433 domain-containing protein [candidate division KSB1 bacterium]